jgi:hypothetical protein
MLLPNERDDRMTWSANLYFSSEGKSITNSDIDFLRICDFFQVSPLTTLTTLNSPPLNSSSSSTNSQSPLESDDALTAGL